MSEGEAKQWLTAQFGERAFERLQRYVELLLANTSKQNLIAPSTVEQVWVRHIADSAQLLAFAQTDELWIDIGSGAGLPGLVIAALRDAPIALVEPRRQRAEFLRACVEALGLTNVTIEAVKIEALSTAAQVISARAVAPVEKLLQAAAACATTTTRWLLPRGRSGQAELLALKQRWAGVFHMKQSLTDPESTILLLDGPHRR